MKASVFLLFVKEIMVAKNTTVQALKVRSQKGLLKVENALQEQISVIYVNCYLKWSILGHLWTHYITFLLLT